MVFFPNPNLIAVIVHLMFSLGFQTQLTGLWNPYLNPTLLHTLNNYLKTQTQILYPKPDYHDKEPG